MPKVRVDIVKGTRTPEQKKKLLDVIHETLVQAIGIPVDDRLQLLLEHDRANFYIPFKLSHMYVNIDIVMYPGRADEAKKKLFELIKGGLTKEGCQLDEVMITLHDPSLANWG